MVNKVHVSGVTAIVLLAIFFVLTIELYGYTVSHISLNPTYVDFGKFYTSIAKYLAGQDPYSKLLLSCYDLEAIPHRLLVKSIGGNLNPPFFLLLTFPLILLSYKTAIVSWLFLSLCAGGVGIYWAATAFERYKGVQGIGWLLLFFLCALNYYPIFGNTGSGQVAFFLLLFLSGAFKAYRAGDERTAGILLGILTAWKLFSGVFFFFFLIQRARRALVWMAGSCLVAMLLSAIVLGPDVYVYYFRMLHNVSWYSASWNVSILGFLTRVFGTGPGTFGLLPHPEWISWLYVLSATLLFLGLGWLAWPRGEVKDPEFSRDLGYSFTIIIMLLLSPLGWAYYFVVLVIPFFAILYWSKRKQHTFLVQFFLSVCLWIGGLPIHGASHPVYFALVGSTHQLYTLIFLALLLLFLYRLPPRVESASKDASFFTMGFIFSLALIPSMLTTWNFVEKSAAEKPRVGASAVELKTCAALKYLR